jgi:hypothetical protein
MWWFASAAGKTVSWLVVCGAWGTASGGMLVGNPLPARPGASAAATGEQ